MRKPDLGKNIAHVHFIGIGGVSMSGLAELLACGGYTVTGSDGQESDATRRLRKKGIPVTIGNHAENLSDDIDLLVYTAAVRPDNPEYAAAVQKNIPAIDRARLLGMIIKGYKHTVCIAGTHGKTTTTSIVADMCLTAGLDPAISIGGYMGEGYNYRVGNSSCFVMEACEYFDSFLQWKPYAGVILNIDSDHMDYFGTMDRLMASFRQFALNIAEDGALIIYSGTQGFARITEGLKCRVVDYGLDNGRFRANHIVFDDRGRPSFDLLDNGVCLSRVKLPLRGEHNLLNALAAAAVGVTLGIPHETVAKGLNTARGVKRRFELKGVYNGAEVADDYSHHPTEIKAALATAKAGVKGKIICVFQPHTYSRTKNLMAEFSTAFTDADLVVLLPIYASREALDGSVSSAMLAENIRRTGQNVMNVNSFDEAEVFLREKVMPGDLLITMGAGDVYLLGERMLRTDLSTLSTTS